MFNFVPANLTRRSFGSVALAVAAADVLGEKTTQASQPTTRVDILTAADGATLEANKGIEAGDLFVSYADIGPATGSPVLLLHGWPYDINSFALVSCGATAARASLQPRRNATASRRQLQSIQSS